MGLRSAPANAWLCYYVAGALLLGILCLILLDAQALFLKGHFRKKVLAGGAILLVIALSAVILNSSLLSLTGSGGSNGLRISNEAGFFGSERTEATR